MKNTLSKILWHCPFKHFLRKGITTSTPWRTPPSTIRKRRAKICIQKAKTIQNVFRLWKIVSLQTKEKELMLQFFLSQKLGPSWNIGVFFLFCLFAKISFFSISTKSFISVLYCKPSYAHNGLQYFFLLKIMVYWFPANLSQVYQSRDNFDNGADIDPAKYWKDTNSYIGMYE